jgi:acetyl-CoA carboxylase carboxyltransferase component
VSDSDSWQPEIDELRRREQQSRGMGGPDKIRRQHDAGRLTVRERIDELLDPESFREIGALAGRSLPSGEFQPANFVFGRGRLDGRPMVVAGDDFTVRGGASDASIREKQIMAEQLAHELQLPLVRLVEGTGGGGSIRSLEAIGRTYVPANPGWEWVVANLGAVPVVSLALGPVAGLGAARVAASHYSIMVQGAAQVFAAGPPLVARVGAPITKEELGGSEIHGTNGVVSDVVASEKEAFERTRRFLSYLPPSVHQLPGRAPCEDDTDRREDWLISAIPRNRRRPYPIRPIIEAVVDEGSFLELGKKHGRSAVTGLARLDGWPVAVLAGDPTIYGGGMTAGSARKIEWFVDLAQTFHLPVVHLVDQPGFVIGAEAERAATMRFGVRALSAVYQASVPWCSVILRKVFGVAGAAHTNASKVQYRFAWPSADWGSLPLEGGIEAAYRADLEASDDPEAMLGEIWERMNSIRSPFRTAEAFNIEEIIDPRDTRPLLCEFAELAAPLRTAGPASWRFRG